MHTYVRIRSRQMKVRRIRNDIGAQRETDSARRFHRATELHAGVPAGHAINKAG